MIEWLNNHDLVAVILGGLVGGLAGFVCFALPILLLQDWKARKKFEAWRNGK